MKIGRIFSNDCRYSFLNWAAAGVVPGALAAYPGASSAVALASLFSSAGPWAWCGECQSCLLFLTGLTLANRFKFWAQHRIHGADWRRGALHCLHITASFLDASLAGKSLMLSWSEKWGELCLAHLGLSAVSRVVKEDEKPPWFCFRLCLGVSLWEKLL